MPNWCSNYVTVTHNDPAMIQKFVEAAKQEKIAETFFPQDTSLPQGEQGFLSDSEFYWRVGNWGVKWDFGGDFDGDANTVSGYVDTAWAPPLGVFRELVHHGFDVHAYWHEGGMCFAGEFENGEVTDYNDIEYTFDGLEGLPETIVEIFNLNDMVDDSHDSEDCS